MCARHTTMHCQHISTCRTDLESNFHQSQVFFAYIAAFLGYMFIRITKTLALGNYFVYGLFVLGVEILGATTTIIYGAPCLILFDPTAMGPARRQAGLLLIWGCQ